MSDNVQDVLQRREWPSSGNVVDLSPCKLKKRRSFRFATWFYRDFKSYSKSEEETDVWRFGSLLFCLDRLRGSSHDRKRIPVWCLRPSQPEMEAKSREEPSCAATSDSELAIRHLVLYLSCTWAATDAHSKWRPRIAQVAHWAPSWENQRQKSDWDFSMEIFSFGQFTRAWKQNQKVINSSLSAPTKIEELTAGSDEKNTAQPRRESNPGSCGCQFFYLCRSWKEKSWLVMIPTRANLR